MIDQFGNKIRIGWAAHETLWVEAAMTLPRSERKAAFYDIAEMTGRSFCAIQSRAEKLAADERDRKIREMIAERARFTASVIPSSGIRPLTRAQLMRGRA